MKSVVNGSWTKSLRRGKVYLRVDLGKNDDPTSNRLLFDPQEDMEPTYSTYVELKVLRKL